VVVTDNGSLGGRLLGIVTSRDIDFINDRLTPLEEVMTRDVLTAPEGEGGGVWVEGGTGGGEGRS
jgi:IMP dehydrogenase